MDKVLIDFVNLQEDLDQETKDSYLKVIQTINTGEANSKYPDELLEFEKYLQAKLKEVEDDAIATRNSELLDQITSVRLAMSKMLIVLADNNTK